LSRQKLTAVWGRQQHGHNLVAVVKPPGRHDRALGPLELLLRRILAAELKGAPKKRMAAELKGAPKKRAGRRPAAMHP
jgi:hypothetical protein